VTDEDSHTDITTKTVSVSTGGGGGAPTASFTYSVDNYTVAVNASGSLDPEGNITSYQWDWDGDGYYDTVGSNAVVGGHVYTEEGTYNLTLRVVDNESNDDTVMHQVEINVTSSDDDGGSSGWLDWNIDISTWLIGLMVGVATMGGGFTAYFMKPEIRKKLGIVASLATMFSVLFIVMAIIVYHADVHPAYFYATVAALIGTVAVTIKYYWGKL
jgi:PKD repeat protein